MGALSLQYSEFVMNRLMLSIVTISYVPTCSTIRPVASLAFVQSSFSSFVPFFPLEQPHQDSRCFPAFSSFRRPPSNPRDHPVLMASPPLPRSDQPGGQEGSEMGAAAVLYDQGRPQPVLRSPDRTLSLASSLALLRRDQPRSAKIRGFLRSRDGA